MKKVLITGGAGFIGLNMALELLNNGSEVLIVDDLKNSYKKYVDSLINKFSKFTFIKGDVCNKSFMTNIFKNNSFDGVVHLSAHKYIGESFKKKDEYMYNNLTSLKVVLDLMTKFSVKKLLFASSVTVYGVSNMPIENSPLNPISPYAESKKIGEEMVVKWSKNNVDKKAIIFRFANPTGANTEYNLGNHSKKGFRSLMGDLVYHAISGEKLFLRGNTHNTYDGTTIRDYIHISDISRITMNVFSKEDKNFSIYNLGRGKGFSVLEMLKMTEDVTGKKINYSFKDREEGDIPIIETNVEKIKTVYGIDFKFGLKEMIDSEYKFYLKNILR